MAYNPLRAKQLDMAGVSTALTDFVGADGENAGAKGGVPAPGATDDTKFLKGDGTWSDPGAGAIALGWAKANKNQNPSGAVSSDAGSTGITIVNTPADEIGYVKIEVNGQGVVLGDGVKTGVDCFFSADGGTTARAIGAIEAGDTLYFNGSSSFPLATSDCISMFYLMDPEE